MIDFSLTSVQTGALLSIIPSIYIFIALVVPQIPERIENRVILLTACLFMGIFTFLIGPSQILALPETLVLTIIGLIMAGIFFAPMIIPVLPEMMEAAND